MRFLILNSIALYFLIALLSGCVTRRCYRCDEGVVSVDSSKRWRVLANYLQKSDHQGRVYLESSPDSQGFVPAGIYKAFALYGTPGFSDRSLVDRVLFNDPKLTLILLQPVLKEKYSSEEVSDDIRQSTEFIEHEKELVIGMLATIATDETDGFAKKMLLEILDSDVDDMVKNDVHRVLSDLGTRHISSANRP